MDSVCFSPWNDYYRSVSVPTLLPIPSASCQVFHRGPGAVGSGRPKVGLIKRRHKDTVPPVLPSSPQAPPLMSAWPPLDSHAKNDLTARFTAQMLAFVLRPSAEEEKEEAQFLQEALAEAEERAKGKIERRKRGRRKKKKNKEVTDAADSDEEEKKAATGKEDSSHHRFVPQPHSYSYSTLASLRTR